MQFVFVKQTNIFSLFYNVFQMFHSPGNQKSGLCSIGLNMDNVTDTHDHHLKFNPSLHKYSFGRINNRQLLKTLWEKEKLLVTSNFSFSHNVFNSIRL